LRELTEADAPASFRDRVLAGTESTIQLFAEEVGESAQQYLADRYPHPRVISRTKGGSTPTHENQLGRSTTRSEPQADQVSPSEEVVPEVWVFPGQGSFDAELLSDRVKICTDMSADIRRQLDDSIEIASQLIGGDAAAVVSGSAKSCRQAVRETPGLSQVAIYLQSVLGAKIRQQAHRPAILMGHSFGEIAALSVAGCFPLHVGVRIVCERVRAVQDFGPPNGALLVATTCRPSAAEEIATSGLSQLVIAGRNHDRQTVVSGPGEQLDRLRTHLQSKGVQAISIDSPTSFHHPQLRSAAAAWLRQLDKIPIQAPTSTVYSPIGRRLISANDDIKAVLCSQFVRPFDLQGAIDDLIAGGFTRFVDCGSAGSTARLLKAAGPNSIHVERVGAPTSTTSVRTNGVALQAPGKKNDVTSDTTSQLATKPSVRSSEARPCTTRPPIAIVAEGCLLPGRATSPAELYAAISQGRQGIFDQRDFDADWERDFYSPSLIPDKSTSPLAGLVDDRDMVPPDNIDPGVFAQFSRAQKLLCVALAPCVNVIRESGKVLCLMGTSADGFQDQDNVAALRYAGIDLSDPQIVERLGGERSVFQDPYVAVQEVFDRAVRPGLDLTLLDAACASSLYAVALGMQALENHEADVVVAGGLFCPGPGNNCLFSQFGGLTSTGCRPFDDAADGVVFSEGAAIVVLRRLADARQSSQNVAAIVRGAGLSSDGRSPSANVPQTAGQLLALQRCYANYDVDPKSVVAIEAHGTSTPVGDVTELNTLREFFAGQAQSPVLVHSLKGLLGHTGWAAGAASVIAASEMMRTGVFPAQAGHRHPSPALVDAKEVLTVPVQPVPLCSTAGRIAIDSLGFGGTNAHLVIEPDVPDTTTPDINTTIANTLSLPTDDSLVVVAWHQLIPTTHSAADSDVLRFERENIVLPKGVVLLPDLADDMDVTQALALSVVGETLAQVPLTDDLRAQTGIVLALEGKTERAVEATSRVLAPRLSRMFEGLPAANAIDQAAHGARPSGPYTLQCMMPNVSAGRAALTFNLNGPNFAVDAGANSLEAAFRAARLLLGNGQDIGTKLIVVAGINANRWPVPNSDAALSNNEYAAAFAITTDRHAKALSLDVVCPLGTMLSNLNSVSQPATTEDKLAVCLKSLKKNVSPPAPPTNFKKRENQFPIHSPVWVETRATPRSSSPLPTRSEDWLVIAEATEETTAELVTHLPDHCQRQMVVLVGPASAAVAARATNPNVLAMDLSDEHSINSALNKIYDFAPQVVLALSKNLSWEFTQALDHVSRNELSASLFLTMQRLVARVRNGETEMWAVFPGSWRQVIHPVTGAASGLIKSVKRELPDACLGVLGHSSNSIGDVLAALQHERSIVGNHEQDVAYDGHQRLVRRLRKLETDCAPQSESRIPLDASSVVVASGGARGVTAVLVESLLRDYGCTVVALGRSQLEPGPDCFDSAEVEREYYAKFIADNPQASPPEMKQSFESARARWEAKRKMDELAGVGGWVRYLTVDVTDRNAVEQAVENIAAEFGKIDLIVHGAGVQWSKKLQDRSLAEFRQTFDVKVNGLRNLLESCRSCLGRAVPAHLLTSAYSIFGNDGQHDYGAANETLDRLCELTNICPEHDWISIAWSAWDGIGMTRGSEYRTLAEKRNLALLDASAGQDVFKAVMEGRTKSRINVPLSESERTQYHVPTIPPSITTATKRSFEFPICLKELDCLAFHKARGVPTLPGAWIVDYMVQAALQIVDASAEYLTIENANFLRMVRIANNFDPNLRVIVDATPTGCDAWLIGDVLNPTGIRLSSDVVFAQATLSKTNHSSQSAPSLNGMLRNGHGTVRTVDDPYCAKDQDVQLSGIFDCLPNVEIGPLGRRAIFSPHEVIPRGGTIPALLLDASLRVAGMHVVPDKLHVPTRIDKVIVPIGLTTDSFAAAGWQIRTCSPRVAGDEIFCDRVEVTDQNGYLQLVVTGATVTSLR
jgi:acyl transferase domain-containing protein/NAD(P)-dependent dehydrogenase (short-subunit alcohol dehydrogenase family)